MGKQNVYAQATRIITPQDAYPVMRSDDIRVCGSLLIPFSMEVAPRQMPRGQRSCRLRTRPQSSSDLRCHRGSTPLR